MSRIFEGGLVSPDATDALGSHCWVQALLRFEAELIRAQAAAGLVPQSAAVSILGTCKAELFDTEKLVRERSRVDGLVTPLVKNLKEMVGIFNPDAVRFVHFGASNQDALDTAMALVTSQALQLIRVDLKNCAQLLVVLAKTHLRTRVLVRAPMRPASVTTLGLLAANWAAPLVRSLESIDIASQHALQLQLTDADPTVLHAVASALQLGHAETPLQPRRDTWAALGCELALVIGSLGKAASDFLHMAQCEPGAVEGLDAVGCGTCLVAAQSAPQRLATLLATLHQPHEGAMGAWQAEHGEWSQLVRLAHGTTNTMAQLLAAISFDSDRFHQHADDGLSQQLAEGYVARQLAAWIPKLLT